MTSFPLGTKSLAALSLLTMASTAVGQGGSMPATTHSAAAAVSTARNAAPAPMPAPIGPGQLARPSLAAASARNVQPAPPAKPFQMAPQRPTVSPYLQLYRDEMDDAPLPNYFAFVLPQIRQQELLHQQQVELERIQQRLGRPGGGAGQAAAASAPEAGTQPLNYHARFLNTGGYFSGVASPQGTAGEANP